MTFPTNNLPTQSKFWGREVEKKITNLEGSFKSAEINNVTRDSQLSVTAGQALTAANNATAAAAAAGAAAAAAGAAAATANNALIGLGSLDESTSTYKINADNLVAGTITAIDINGSTITGSTLTTASPGSQRVVLNSNSITLNNGSSDTGSIYGSSKDGAAATYIDGTRCVLQSSLGNYLIGSTGVYSGSFSVGDGSITTGGSMTAHGNVTSTTGTVSGAVFSGGSITTGTLSVGTMNAGVFGGGTTASGGLSAGTISAGNFNGTSNTSIAANTQSSFVGNLFINASGQMFRYLSSSTREVKENIQPYEFDTESFIAVNPVTFNYKPSALSDPEEAEVSQLGFILEDFEDAGLADYLVIPSNEVDPYKGLRYDKLYMMLHKVVQEQGQTIKDLTARIEALESR
jgi:hypothetical protein